MRRILTLLVGTALALGASLAEAKNFTIGDSKPVAVISIPDEWNPTAIEDGAEATSPDNTVYIAVEAVEIKDIESATREGIKFFDKSGVTLDASTMKQKETKISGLPAIDVTWRGKDKDGPTNVSLTFVIVSPTNSVLLYFWGSDAGVQKNVADLKSIADSLRPVSR